MPALRVLQVTPYYAEAWAYGGVPRAATALARGLARRGHKVTVCTTDAAEPAARARGLAGADGVDVRVFPNVSNALAYHLQLFLPRGMDAWLAAHARDFVVADAFAALDDRTATLVIAGNDLGSGAETRRRAQRLGVHERVVFTGLLRGAERLEALADADVVVYPARDEVFGLVAVEALLAGTPVIVADDSGCAEVIAATGGGRIVAQGDVAALAAAVRDVLAAPARYQVAEADRRIRAWLASDAIAARLETVYEALVAVAPFAVR